MRKAANAKDDVFERYEALPESYHADAVAQYLAAQTRILDDAEANRNEALVRSFFEQNGAPVITLDDYPFCRSVIEALTIQQDIVESEAPRPVRAAFSRTSV